MHVNEAALSLNQVNYYISLEIASTHEYACFACIIVCLSNCLPLLGCIAGGVACWVLDAGWRVVAGGRWVVVGNGMVGVGWWWVLMMMTMMSANEGEGGGVSL